MGMIRREVARLFISGLAGYVSSRFVYIATGDPYIGMVSFAIASLLAYRLMRVSSWIHRLKILGLILVIDIFLARPVYLLIPIMILIIYIMRRGLSSIHHLLFYLMVVVGLVRDVEEEEDTGVK
jgi:hypothetical protein